MKKINVKLVLLGDAGVGKTSIVNNYVYKNFRFIVESTIGASFTSKKLIFHYNPKTYKISETHNINKNHQLLVNIHIWDTAGQEKYKSLASMYYKNANIVFYIFDIDKFNNKMDKKVYEDLNQDSIKYLIYNKIDLVTDNLINKKKKSTYHYYLESYKNY